MKKWRNLQNIASPEEEDCFKEWLFDFDYHDCLMLKAILQSSRKKAKFRRIQVLRSIF
jgi:hypothetical protein